MDIRAHNGTIDHLDGQKENISKEIHGFQNDQYHKLQIMQKHSIGC